MKKLYKFHWDCGRMGDLGGVFVAEESDVAEALGKPVHFGEVLGKHLGISGRLREVDLRVVTDDQAFVAKFEELGLETGYNPLSYLAEEGGGG